MNDDTIEINLSWYMPGFVVNRDLADKDLALAIHKTMAEYFASFEVVVERVERDGKDRLLGCRVGIVKK